MQEKIFTINCFEGAQQNEELNRFLRGVKIVGIEKQFFCISDNPYWTFCVEYVESPVFQQKQERKEKVDYKNVLDPSTFEVFSKLRVIRKKLAEVDAVPAYSVFTDAELAEMSKLQEFNDKSLKSINGIGEKRVEKYGHRMVEEFYKVPTQG